VKISTRAADAARQSFAALCLGPIPRPQRIDGLRGEPAIVLPTDLEGGPRQRRHRLAEVHGRLLEGAIERTLEREHADDTRAADER